jgi:hypothetical protein
MIESIGPIAKGIAASMEAGNAKVAYQMKFMIPQWMDTRRIIEYIGPDKLTPEIFDYDPASIVPSHLADEYMGNLRPFDIVDGETVQRASRYDKLQRARSFAANLRLISVPSTLLKITQAQEQLKYLQLYRDQFPISPHTVAKKLGIENFGEIPGKDEFEKWVNWKKIQIALMAQEQQLAGQLGLGGGDEGGGGGEGGGTEGTPKKPTGKPEGRPPSGKEMPKIVQKGKHDGKPRTTITESK